MTWAKLDDRANEHRKQLDAGPEACWLWACGLMYANRQDARDGFIPERVLAMLYPFKKPAVLAAKLVEVGLWERAPGGYSIHQFTFWNRSKEQIEAERESTRIRVAKHRNSSAPETSNGGCNGVTPEQPSTVTNGTGNGNVPDHSSSTPTPTPSDPPNPQGGLAPSAVEDSDSVFASKVFDFWRKVHDHPKAKLDRKRQRKILARRREGFTGKELCQAIRGAKLDPHLMGESRGSDGRVYDGLQTILRDAEQVERLMALAGAPRVPGGPSPEARRIRAEHDARVEAEAKAHQELLAASLHKPDLQGATVLPFGDIRQLTGGIGG